MHHRTSKRTYCPQEGKRKKKEKVHWFMKFQPLETIAYSLETG
jgi:hypothetical protein